MPKQPDWTLGLAAKVRRHQLRHHRKAGEALREILLDGLRHAVLSTTELLELILVHLPNADLERLRKVCRKWNATILSSPALQSKFFMTIREPLDRFWSIASFSPLSPPQPLEGFKLVPISASIKNHQARLLISQASTNRAYGSTLVVLRPVQLNPLFRTTELSDWEFATGFGQYVHLKLDSVASMLSGHWTSPKLLDSFITDPPCYNAYIYCQWRGRHKLPKKAGEKRVWCVLGSTVHSAAGLTVRDIARAFFQDRRAKTLVHQTLESFPGSWTFPTLVNHLKRLGYKDDEEFCLKSFKLTLFGVIVPTEEQWRTVQ
ncbi:uncharacterized protein RHO25_013085 [Cercospora beticola]|uniref:F-box domain-containing protein n=1 Tax=Cercospora beticola TaxID=122368 RepID=A0ABZ0PAC3_CERBT|nr:hypothetical protein RHO25_013085 [Cercospora beticola]CAK1367682.1 unnamed protein product [Cercospora beticola]